MEHLSRRDLLAGAAGCAALAAVPPAWAEPRDAVGFLRGPYNLAFYHRHNRAYRIGAGMHFFHSKQHDLLQLTPLADHRAVDARFYTEALAHLTKPPRTEPEMEYYSEFVDRTMHTVFRAIDWTHMHHEQTYDILSHKGTPWSEKAAWTDRAVRYYLTQETSGVPRSCAPLDVTMRRAAVMTKPYFTFFRNYYPKDQGLFYVAHWWHPAVYEIMTMAGNTGQEAGVQAVDDLMFRSVVPDVPGRMILSREVMPRYSRMSPESANIFDNLHMLHGLTYDILAYEGWSVEQKRAELYRVIHAMSYQPGDEKLARKFSLPHPDFDPRAYPDWVRSADGEMGRIMMEMMDEMLSSMMPGMDPAVKPQVMAAVKVKLGLGFAPGEREGSLHDTLMALMPGMRMMPGATEPGGTPRTMVDAMLAGWRAKHGSMPDIPPLDMGTEPTLPPAPAQA